MKGFLIRLLASAAALIIVSHSVEGFTVQNWGAALMAVVVLAIGNAVFQVFGNVIKTAGCLINLLTLGLFGLAVSFFFWWLTFWFVGYFLGDALVPGFEVTGAGPAAIGALVLALVNMVLTPLLDRDEARRREERRRERERR